MEVLGPGRVLRFGCFELDPEAGELRRDGAKIRLQEQRLQILTVLLVHPGKLVSRDELREKIWPSDTFVDFDHGINNAIKRLREALGDPAESPAYKRSRGDIGCGRRWRASATSASTSIAGTFGRKAQKR